MPVTSIAAGILLIIVGAIGYGNAISNGLSGTAARTALIPALFGIILIVCGAIAMAVDRVRKHLMHLAVVVAFLGFILTAGRLVMKLATGGLEASPAVMSQGAMAAVCLVFVVLAIRSFAASRSTNAG